MSNVQKTLLGIVALLQAVLTAVGTNNGGLAALVISKPAWAYVGFGLVGVAVLVGALLAAFPAGAAGHGVLRKALVGTAVVALVVGVATTAFAAIFAPAFPGEPSIAVSLNAGVPIRLHADIKASGISRSSMFHVQVEGLREVPQQTSYRVATPVLYQAQLGSDSAGNVAASLTIPIPAHKYSDVAVAAWTGDHPGPCAALVKAKTAKPDANARQQVPEGCVVLRIRGLPRTPAG